MYKSSGENTYKLEDYTGKNAIEIKTRLEEKYGLIVKIEKKDDDDQIIIGQSLAADSEVKKGDTLTLYTPNIVDEFPDMAAEGWNLSDAEAFCNKYGLILEKVEQETTAYSEGTIIGQSRTAGSTIIKGTTLKVTVAIKPKAKPKEEEKKTDDDTSKEEDKDKNTVEDKKTE